VTAAITKRLEEVKRRIQRAAQASGRNLSDIRLVAVSKTCSTEAIRAAATAGVTDIGENYIQEAREKHELLQDVPVKWHLIGHLQTNKARYAVRMFDLVHTVDSFRLALELDRCARKLNKVQAVLIQVNVAGEATKSGIPPEQALPLVKAMAALECVQVQGFMTMPPFFNEPERVRPFFAELRRLRERIRHQAVPNVRLDELSMGMTGDFEAAVAEGATLVRIGTAIFGDRP
jgi:pyridoxal phosphate enzyme (YggS family)